MCAHILPYFSLFLKYNPTPTPNLIEHADQ